MRAMLCDFLRLTKNCSSVQVFMNLGSIEKTGEVIDSFAIVTTEPDEFIKKTGHDRSPLFLPEAQWSHWLAAADQPGPGVAEVFAAKLSGSQP
jgi:putative SOS response-associated peptidase YedK